LSSAIKFLSDVPSWDKMGQDWEIFGKARPRTFLKPFMGNAVLHAKSFAALKAVFKLHSIQ
jgi:hypothetical protein